MTKKNHTYIFLLLLILTFISFSNFVKIGFVNSDDADCYLRAHNGNVLSDSIIWAKGQGRFYFIYRNLLASIPYFINSFLYTKILQYLPILFNFILSSLIITKELKSIKLGYSTYFLFILFFSVPADEFTPPIAYPFLFSIDILFFLFAYYYLLIYKEQKKTKYYYFSLLFFFIPYISFEAYWVLLPFYCFLILYKLGILKNGLIISNLFSKDLIKLLSPIFIFIIIYLIIYFGFRIKYPSSYNGNTIAKNLDLNNLFKFIWNLNKTAFPTIIFHQNQFLFPKNLDFFKSICIETYVFSITSTIVTLIIFRKNQFNYPIKKLMLSIGLLLLISYSINLTPGITEKYNSKNTLNSYVTTYIAFYSMSISLLIVIVLIKQITSKHKILNYIISSLFICTVLITSIVIQTSNKKISNLWINANKRFENINLICKSEVIKSIPENSILYIPFLNNQNSKIGNNITTNTFSWSKYIFINSKRKYVICEKISDLTPLAKEFQTENIYKIIIKNESNIYTNKIIHN